MHPGPAHRPRLSAPPGHRGADLLPVGLLAVAFRFPEAALADPETLQTALDRGIGRTIARLRESGARCEHATPFGLLGVFSDVGYALEFALSIREPHVSPHGTHAHAHIGMAIGAAAGAPDEAIEALRIWRVSLAAAPGDLLLAPSAHALLAPPPGVGMFLAPAWQQQGAGVACWLVSDYR